MAGIKLKGIVDDQGRSIRSSRAPRLWCYTASHRYSCIAGPGHVIGADLGRNGLTLS